MPIWRRLLRLHLDHPNPEVAQQAAAALADLRSEADTDWDSITGSESDADSGDGSD
jgi:hypothetical protein